MTAAPATDHKPFDLEQLKQIVGQTKRIVSEIPSVILSLTSPDEETRAWAADCLQEVEQLTTAQADTIESYCEHECQFVAFWTCKLLGRAQNVDRYQEKLAKCLASRDEVGVRQVAAQSLAGVKVASESALLALTAASQSSDPRLQRLATETLKAIQ